MKAPLNRATVLALGRVESARRVIAAAQVHELEHIAASAANAGQRIEEAEARCLADLEHTTHSAWQRGYARGHAEALERLHAMLAALDAKRKALEPELIELVVDAIGRIVRGLPADVLTQGLITTALEESQCDRGRLVLRVHPKDAEVAERWLGLPAASREHTRITLEIDASVPSDGCVLETPAGAIDASLTTQLAALREHMLQAVASGAVIRDTGAS
jgi:type III secretion protein L